MTTNVPLSRKPARRGSLLCESGPIHVVSFYLITRHNSLIIVIIIIIPIFTHKVSHNKWPKVYGFTVHLLHFQKPVHSYTFTFFLTCSVFLTFFHPSLPHLPLFFSLSNLTRPPPQTRFYKPYPQSKTFLNIRAVPSSAVFCSNMVLITTSSSMHFFSSFDVPLLTLEWP